VPSKHTSYKQLGLKDILRHRYGCVCGYNLGKERKYRPSGFSPPHQGPQTCTPFSFMVTLANVEGPVKTGINEHHSLESPFRRTDPASLTICSFPTLQTSCRASMSHDLLGDLPTPTMFALESVLVGDISAFDQKPGFINTAKPGTASSVCPNSSQCLDQPHSNPQPADW
jgi:hypothetical protein